MKKALKVIGTVVLASVAAILAIGVVATIQRAKEDDELFHSEGY